MTSNKNGSLTCVGVGITLGAHLTPIARSHIEQADVVFSLGNTGLMKQWLLGINSNIIDLQSYYQQGKPRSLSYQQMQHALLEPVRAGKKVVAAFYGHPGVFVTPSHKAIAQAKDEGFQAKMLPGISAEDCLIADCGIDPGRTGSASFEASQFIRYHKQIDTSAYLFLWQVSVVGDTRLTKFATDKEYRALLIEVLQRNYPDDHPIIIYQAATIATEQPRIEHMPLHHLLDVKLHPESTLVVTPIYNMRKDEMIEKRLLSLDKSKLKQSLTSITNDS
ncbi:hypothetical protein E2K93_03995 [Thalassotalea sp. HSM 43]|uniref:SAM-dependent methyltransferase n=1 Tax=Thalassotalea sp. HSM 43 TaxID=2552945 RepID=UPI0010804682|nr:SAM-dependent methyltransferase [Thalassotalea sp. HSM 43]QBY03590.1 hypothetical protein E2K93_03995 [Thalassotalea sp. HSM 43]